MAWSGSQPRTRYVTSVTAAKQRLVLNPGLGYFAIQCTFIKHTFSLLFVPTV